MSTPEPRSELDERGYVRLRGVFSRAEAAAMEARIWAALTRKHGVCRDDPRSWALALGTGLQSLRSHAVFRPIGGPALRAALDDLIGEGRWQEPKHWGQFLVSFPVTAGASQPSRALWHTDFPYSLPGDRVVGALVFSFVSEVSTGAGGTLVIAGSQRLVRRFVGTNPHLSRVRMKVARRALMGSDPWLADLCESQGDWARRFAGSEHTIGDIALRVVELTGEPGDVVIGHPWLLHSPAPNRGDRPRFMRVQRVRPARSSASGCSR